MMIILIKSFWENKNWEDKERGIIFWIVNNKKVIGQIDISEISINQELKGNMPSFISIVIIIIIFLQFWYILIKQQSKKILLAKVWIIKYFIMALLLLILLKRRGMKQSMLISILIQYNNQEGLERAIIIEIISMLILKNCINFILYVLLILIMFIYKGFNIVSFLDYESISLKFSLLYKNLIRNAFLEWLITSIMKNRAIRM